FARLNPERLRYWSSGCSTSAVDTVTSSAERSCARKLWVAFGGKTTTVPASIWTGEPLTFNVARPLSSCTVVGPATACSAISLPWSMTSKTTDNWPSLASVVALRPPCGRSAATAAILAGTSKTSGSPLIGWIGMCGCATMKTPRRRWCRNLSLSSVLRPANGHAVPFIGPFRPAPGLGASSRPECALQNRSYARPRRIAKNEQGARHGILPLRKEGPRRLPHHHAPPGHEQPPSGGKPGTRRGVGRLRRRRRRLGSRLHRRGRPRLQRWQRLEEHSRNVAPAART